METNLAYKNSKNTAIGRTRLSLPMKLIRKHAADIWHGRRLDFGCGRGYCADYLRMEKYDPHHHPEKPRGTFDVVTCNYVLNVLPKSLEKEVLTELAECLNDTATCFITVRRDIKHADGFTARKTYQRNVELPFKRLTKKAGYEIYETNKQELKEYCNEN
jgi:2-polyprenyl-3-methyl-5-hydroxy-6-metoxy-1,4-benzoquinol methylase